jgi:hypothetical protein
MSLKHFSEFEIFIEHTLITLVLTVYLDSN